jgi:hypothetical protein
MSKSLIFRFTPLGALSVLTCLGASLWIGLGISSSVSGGPRYSEVDSAAAERPVREHFAPGLESVRK